LGKKADSVAEWVQLARQNELVCTQLLANQQTVPAAFNSAGLACECILKAAIMRKFGFNQWPDRKVRPDLYVHDLLTLAKILGFAPKPVDAVAPYWAVMTQWEMTQRYEVVTPQVSQQICGAAFKPKVGVLEWISQNYL